MTDFDEIKQYLPKYLSPDAQESLFRELEAFTDQPHDRLYSGLLDSDEGILQGDGLKLMPISNLPAQGVKEGPVMVLSNTCDLDKDNRRHIPSRLSYYPLVKLSNLVALLNSHGVPKETIEQVVDNIKKQRVTSIFFLPQSSGLPEDYVALLDRPNNCNLAAAPKVGDRSDSRIFSLSQFGWYLFLFKISLHLTRMQEAVERG